MTIIGKGAFGEVRLVRNKKTGEVMAMKKMKKTEMITKHQINHVKAEKEVLAKAQNPWIVDLKFSFQVSIFTSQSLLRTNVSFTSLWNICQAEI